MEPLPIHHIIGPSRALEEPSEDRECTEVGEGDPAKRLGQTLKRGIKIPFTLTDNIRYLKGRYLSANNSLVPIWTVSPEKDASA